MYTWLMGGGFVRRLALYLYVYEHIFNNRYIRGRKKRYLLLWFQVLLSAAACTLSTSAYPHRSAQQYPYVY